jgi:hypothetical protein
MYSFDGQYPIAELPFRIMKPNGITITSTHELSDEEFDRQLVPIGWKKVDSPPGFDMNTSKLDWGEDGWKVVDLAIEELESHKLQSQIRIRLERDNIIKNIIWRIERYESQTRLGLVQSDSIIELDNYVQKLREIPEQSSFIDNGQVDWPNEPLGIDDGVEVTPSS